MAKVEYQSSSPYAKTPQTSWYLGLWEPGSLTRDVTDIQWPVENRFHNRPDLLSYELYGSPNYGWVFMVLNPDQILDPIYDLKAGMVIYVPTRTRLTSMGA
jgi:hypothetical protein